MESEPKLNTDAYTVSQARSLLKHWRQIEQDSRRQNEYALKQIELYKRLLGDLSLRSIQPDK